MISTTERRLLLSHVHLHVREEVHIVPATCRESKSVRSSRFVNFGQNVKNKSQEVFIRRSACSQRVPNAAFKGGCYCSQTLHMCMPLAGEIEIKVKHNQLHPTPSYYMTSTLTPFIDYQSYERRSFF